MVRAAGVIGQFLSLGPQCKAPGKHPIIRDWVNLASCDEGRIRQWWGLFPQANVGICTGGDGIEVPDFDAKNGGLQTLDQLKVRFDIGNPLIVETGGDGRHLIYRSSGKLKSRTNVLGKDAPGMDIRAQGGLIVAPPSTHASGKVYGFNFDSFSGEDTDDLSNLKDPGPIPGPLLEFLLKIQGGSANDDALPISRQPLSEEERKDLIPVIREALRFIPAEDYSTWLSIGMALHHGLGDDGRELWDEWSATSSKYQDKSQQSTWNHLGKKLRARPITLGTLFHLARQGGFTGKIPPSVPTDLVAILVSRIDRKDRAAEFALYVQGECARRTTVKLTKPRGRKGAKTDLWEAASKNRGEANESEFIKQFDAAWDSAEAFANQALDMRPEVSSTDEGGSEDVEDLSPERIEELIDGAMQARDRDCDARISRLSDEERERTISMGRDPNLMLNLIRAVNRLGHVGEHHNAGVLALCYASCRLQKPLHAEIVGPSSGGKSHLCDTVSKLIPSEWVELLTSITPQYLAHLGRSHLACKVVVLGERPLGDEDQVAPRNKLLREMISQRFVKTGTVEKNGSSANVSVTKLVLGPIASSETTTKSEIFAEDQNRRIVLETNQSQEQTVLIVNRHGQEMAGEVPQFPPSELTDIHNMFRSLKRPEQIRIPYGNLIAAVVPTENLEIRRIIGQLGSLIMVCAFIHQMQRKAYTENGQDLPWQDRKHGEHVLHAHPRDYEIVAELINPSLGKALRRDLSAGDKRLLEQIQELVNANERSGQSFPDEFTTIHVRQKIQAVTGKEPNPDNLRKQLRKLMDHKAIFLTHPGGGGEPNRYRLLVRQGLPENSEKPLLPPTYAELCEATNKAPEDLSMQAYSDEVWERFTLNGANQDAPRIQQDLPLEGIEEEAHQVAAFGLHGEPW